MHAKQFVTSTHRPKPLTSSVTAPKISNFSYVFKPLQISETEKIGNSICVCFKVRLSHNNNVHVHYTLGFA